MEFQLVQNCAARENAAFLQVVSCCNAGMLWRCNAGMLVEMLIFNKGFGGATGQLPTDQSNNASSSVQKELEVGTIQDRNEYRTHLRLNHATTEAKRMTE